MCNIHLPVSLYRSISLLTSINIDNIPIMRLNIGIKRPSIAISRSNTLNHLYIRRPHRHVIPTGNPVLRTSMTEPKRRRRQLGDNIIGMRGPPETPLPRHIIRQCLIAHARLAIGILRFHRISNHSGQGIIPPGPDKTHQIKGISRITQRSSSQSRDGSSETVAREYQCIPGVSLHG